MFKLCCNWFQIFKRSVWSVPSIPVAVLGILHTMQYGMHPYLFFVSVHPFVFEEKKSAVFSKVVTSLLRVLSINDVNLNGLQDDSDNLAFKETTWLYNKFVYRSIFMCKLVPRCSQSIKKNTV